MSYTYDQRKRPRGPQDRTPDPSAAPGPGMDALMNGTARPTAAQKGQPFDLDAAMKAKMENAFGDLSAVKFYTSQAVGEAGAEAIAQGNEVAFAPGMADFSTKAGQERLGHELSHVMSQRSGQVRGSGFLANASLEARADREGAMAAAGQQVNAGPVTHTLSDSSPSPMAAGVMQAKRRDADAREVKAMQEKGQSFDDYYATPDYLGYDELNEDEWETKTHRPGFTRIFGKKDQSYKVRRNIHMPKTDYEPFSNPYELNPLHIEKQTRNFDITDPALTQSGDHMTGDIERHVPTRQRGNMTERITGIINEDDYVGGMKGDPGNSDGSVTLVGSGGRRMIWDLSTSATEDMSNDELVQLFTDMYAPGQKKLHGKDARPEDIAAADKQFDQAMKTLKGIYYKQLKRLEATYGTLPTQMHPNDFLSQVGPEFKEQTIHQDWSIFMRNGQKYLDENDEEEGEMNKEFKRLYEYYSRAADMLTGYAMTEANQHRVGPQGYGQFLNSMDMGPEKEEGIGGPKMSPKQLARYNANLKKRAAEEGWSQKLFGHYLNPPPIQDDPADENDPLNIARIEKTPKTKKKKTRKKKSTGEGDLFET